jgi:1-acyl-sn-glycerol-3-phosphate acyltransferase
MSPWVARRWYDFLFWVTFYGFTFGHSLRVIGRRNVPKSGPLLVVCNHQSFFDPVLVGLAVRRYLDYLARDSLFKNRYFAAMIRSVGGLKIDRNFGKEGLQATLDLLDRGRAVLVFPEGERTHDGEMESFKAGISLLIKRVEAPIVPVGLAGAYCAWSRYKKLPSFAPLFLAAKPATIALSVGKPIDPATLKGLSREAMLEKLHQAVEVEFAKAKRLKRK